MFFCSSVLRTITPLQSISALFIADIGRYIGHTAAELQDIRSGLIILARGARALLWLGAGVIIVTKFGADPLVALSGFGAGTLFVGLALRKSVEDACAVVRHASSYSCTCCQPVLPTMPCEVSTRLADSVASRSYGLGCCDWKLQVALLISAPFTVGDTVRIPRHFLFLDLLIYWVTSTNHCEYCFSTPHAAHMVVLCTLLLLLLLLLFRCVYMYVVEWSVK